MKSIILRKNSPELREKLKEIGYHICPCSSSVSENDDFLFVIAHKEDNNYSVHALTVNDEKVEYLLDLKEGKEPKENDFGLDEDAFLLKAKELYNA